jgi:hypothetical protein
MCISVDIISESFLRTTCSDVTIGVVKDPWLMLVAMGREASTNSNSGATTVATVVQIQQKAMGNKPANPVPSFDIASSHYTNDELTIARSKFKSLWFVNCPTHLTYQNSYSDQNIVRLENFIQHSSAPLILKKRLLPRLFEVMDSKKENLIEFESYFCTLSLLRRSNLDELSKCM